MYVFVLLQAEEVSKGEDDIKKSEENVSQSRSSAHLLVCQSGVLKFHRLD